MLTFAAYCVLGTVVLFVPGLLLAWCLRLRGLAMVALAPPLTLAVVGVLGVVAGALHVPFGPLVFVAAVVVASALCYGVTRLIARHRAGWFTTPDIAPNRWWWPWEAGAVVLAAGLLLRALHRVIPHPDDIAQGFDNLFHFNAVQWVVHRHDASSLTLTAMTAGDTAPSYYPAAWHGFVGLLLMILPHADVSVAINATTFVAVALAWPLAAVAMVRATLPRSRFALGAAAVLSLILPAFPLKLMQWGPVYPTVMSWCSILAVVATLVAVFEVGKGSLDNARFPLVAGAVGGGAGVAVTHPSGAVTVVIFATVFALLWWLRIVRQPSASRRDRVVASAVVASVGGLFLVTSIAGRPAYDGAWWPAIVPGGWTHALGMVLGMSGMQERAIAATGAAAILLGCYACLRHRMARWLVVLHALFGWLFMYTFVTGKSRLRWYLTGTWYSDCNRIAPLLVLTGLPLGAAGAWQVSRWGAALLDRVARGRVRWASHRFVSLGLGVALLGAFAVAGLRDRATVETAYDAALSYSANDRGDSVDGEERELLRQLPSVVPPGQRIATTPWNGSSMAYGATGRPTTTTHVFYTPTADVTVINDSLRDAADDPAVCAAVKRLNVHWALDFGEREITGERHPYAGLEHLANTPGFTPVLHVGPKVLYRVDACWR